MIQNEEALEPEKLVDEYIDSTIDQLKDDINQVNFGHRELGSKGFLRDRIQFYKKVKELVEEQRKYKNVEPYLNQIETYHYPEINKILIKIWNHYEPSRKKLEKLDSREHPSPYLGPTACLIDNYCKALKPVKYDSDFIMMHYNSSPEIQMDLMFKAIDKDLEKRANRFIQDVEEDVQNDSLTANQERYKLIYQFREKLFEEVSQEGTSQEQEQLSSIQEKRLKEIELFEKKSESIANKIDLLSKQVYQVIKMLEELQKDELTKVDGEVMKDMMKIKTLLEKRREKEKKKFQALIKKM